MKYYNTFRKFILTAILCLCLVLLPCLSSCTGDNCSHIDSNNDGKCDECAATIGECAHLDSDSNAICDKCEASMPVQNEVITLFKDGSPTFEVLVGSNISVKAKGYVTEFITELNKWYVESGSIKETYDVAEKDNGVEIIFGSVNNRGDKYKKDYHYLGVEGYSVSIADGKIFVLAGGDRGYKLAIEYVKENIMMIDEFTSSITDLAVGSDKSCEVIQTYDIESITINGTPITEYVIAYGETVQNEEVAAKAMRETLYKQAGIWLELVSVGNLEDGAAALYVECTAGNAERSTDDGFVAFVGEDGSLHIECEFPEKLPGSVDEYVSNILLDSKESNVKLYTGVHYTRDVRNIYYSDFGAVGDGVVNDFDAIKACHDYANEWGHTVNATATHTYYIGRTFGETITVRTDVKWNGARFIIDDTTFGKDDADRSAPIFTIESDSKALTYKAGDGSDIGNIIDSINAAGGIDADTCTSLDLGLGYPALLFVYNEEHRNYYRIGAHYEGGTVQREIVCIDADGNIDPKTNFMFDYSKVTGIDVHRIDDKPIVIDGGGASFTTIANQVPFEWNGSSPVYYYHNRNIAIFRSNTIIQNVANYIEGEQEDCGAPYVGFFEISNTNNVLVRDCIVTAHKAYNNMGSYGLHMGSSNGLMLCNIQQSNFFLSDGETVSADDGYWGITESDYCKNMTYDGCMLTRIDAHRGLQNGTIKNSTTGKFTLIGGGLFTIENCTIYAGNRNYLTHLRADYGSRWDGDFLIKDVRIVYTGTWTDTFVLLNAAWYNQDFGYECCAPTTVTVDGLVVESEYVKNILLINGNVTDEGVAGSYIGDVPNLNPYAATETFIVKNDTNGYVYKVPETYDTEIVYE